MIYNNGEQFIYLINITYIALNVKIDINIYIFFILQLYQAFLKNKGKFPNKLMGP